MVLIRSFPRSSSDSPQPRSFISWHRKGALARPAFATGYLQPYRAAVALALIGAASFILVGMPLGVTTSYTKVAGLVERFLFPEHFSGLVFFKNVPLNFMHAMSGTVLTGDLVPATMLWLRFRCR